MPHCWQQQMTFDSLLGMLLVSRNTTVAYFCCSSMLCFAGGYLLHRWIIHHLVEDNELYGIIPDRLGI
jgi:hypothetical protein